MPESFGIYLVSEGHLVHLNDGDSERPRIKISPGATAIVYDKRATLLGAETAVVLRRLELASEPGEPLKLKEKVPVTVKEMDVPDMYSFTPLVPLADSIYRIEIFGRHYPFVVGDEGQGKKARPVSEQTHSTKIDGDPFAIPDQGFVWEPGQGTASVTRPKELTTGMDQAADYYREAIELYKHGHQEEAVRLTTKAAELGYPEAQCSLGALYMYGRGVEKNIKIAFEWFSKAARQGHARAQSNLGVMYEFGQGVGKDYREALRWYKAAATQHYANAENGMAWILATCSDPTLLDGNLAAEYAQRAVLGRPDKSEFVDTLAAAYARCGKFVDAIDQQNKSITMLESDPDTNDNQKAASRAEAQHRLALYKKQQAFVEP